MTREYLVKDEDCNFFCGMTNARGLDGKSEVLMTNSNDASSFMRLRKFESLAEAKETAATLATSKWLNSNGKVFEVVEAKITDWWVERVYGSWWRKCLDIPSKLTFHYPDVVSYVTLWSTAD